MKAQNEALGLKISFYFATQRVLRFKKALNVKITHLKQHFLLIEKNILNDARKSKPSMSSQLLTSGKLHPAHKNRNR